MPSVKIVIVGGGSYGWTPTIVRDIVLTEELSGSEIVLEDISSDTLELTGPVSKKIVEKAGADFKIATTTDEDAALDGADFVVLTISTGGFDAMEHDIGIPLKHGIYQSVGDTCGPGGLARALRNIPVVVDLARKMEKRCPNAWFLNYTNPMTTLCRAVTRETGVPTVGLCHELYGTCAMLQKLLGLEDWKKEIVPKVAGVNHLPWITEMSVNGRDGFAMLRGAIEDASRLDAAEKVEAKTAHAQTLAGKHKVKLALFELYGALPAAGDRHVAEFFPYFLIEETRAGADWGVALTTVEERRTQWHPAAKRRCEEILSGKQEIELVRSHEAASGIMAALAGGSPVIDVVNLPNRGQVPELPYDAVVETMGLVDTTGAHGVAAGRLPPPVRSILDRHVTIQEMTVESALKGDRKLALQALLLDPLVRRYETAEAMLNEMLEANRRHLPRFFG